MIDIPAYFLQKMKATS